MATWIIRDGAPELSRGSFLRGTGVRAVCLSVGPAREPVDDIAEWAGPGGGPRPGGHVHELTGLAGTARDVYAGDGPAERHAGSEFVITTGRQTFTAQARGPASAIPSGTRITAQCLLSVVPDYEWDAFGLPDLRRDWHVLRVKIEHTQTDDAPGHPGPTRPGPTGQVLRSFEIDHMSRWDDDRDPTITAWYVLDLLPAQAS